MSRVYHNSPKNRSISHIYDNWEKLVAAVVKKQELWELFHDHSRENSFSSVSTDFSPTSSGRISFDLSSNQLEGETPVVDILSPISLAYNRLDPLREPQRVPSVFQIGETSRAASPFGSPTIGIAWYQRKKLLHTIFFEVPQLKKSEIEAACEDFSNVLIGSSSIFQLYKGTLSDGVEVAVASIKLAYARHWSNSSEAQFRNKIKTLSNVNHKNFVDVIGYYTEEKPLTRMIFYEYAPKGTLFEYLHVKKAERLDWAKLLRIAMGMAYCLEHMHQLTPPLAIKNFTTLDVYLTDDYAAKVSDFLSWDEGPSKTKKPNLPGNVYSFSVILFEMITGKPPNSGNWLLDYLRGLQPLREMVDPTLETYREDQLLEQIDRLIKLCAASDPKKRPTMKEVCEWLYMITAIDPARASPMLFMITAIDPARASPMQEHPPDSC